MSSLIACGVGDLKKNQRRGTMLECARKKKINYFGVKKADKIIIDMMTGKSKNKIYTLPEARGRAMGLMTRAKKVHGWIVNAGDQEKRTDKVKQWKEELEKLKVDYKKMVPIVERLMKEDKEMKETLRKIKEKKEEELAEKAEAKKKRADAAKKKKDAKDDKKKASKEKTKEKKTSKKK